MDDLTDQIIAFLDAIIAGTAERRITWEELDENATTGQAADARRFLRTEKLYRFFESNEIPVETEGRTVRKKFYVIKKSVKPSAECIIAKNSQEYPYIFLGVDDGQIVAVIDIVMIDFSSRLQALYESIDESLFPKESQFAAFQNGLDINDASNPKRDTGPQNL